MLRYRSGMMKDVKLFRDISVRLCSVVFFEDAHAGVALMMGKEGHAITMVSTSADLGV
jgi:hypothetical protein